MRLDDLWALRLRRADLASAAQHARAALREAHFRALAAQATDQSDPAAAARALHYLRHDLHEALDHSCSRQVRYDGVCYCIGDGM